MTPQEIVSGLDPEQKKAAEALLGPVAIVAGAGTGKTRTITHRIALGVEKEHWDAGSVMAVTFTNKAAREMEERLASLGVKGCRVGTFHALALKQMQYYWPRIVGTVPPRLETNKLVHIFDAAEGLGIELDRRQAMMIADEIGWSKVSLIAPKDYASTAEMMDREIVGQMDLNLVARVYEEYDNTKSDRGMVDFEDLLLLMIHIISTNKTVADELHAQIQHIIVDEYQDVSPLQQELLNAWLGTSKEICVVGDPSQTIYSFTGATSRYLLSFDAKYPDARRVELIRDYRSSPQIVKLANTILKHRGKLGVTPLGLVSKAPDKGIPVEWEVFASDYSEAEGVAKRITKMLAEGSYTHSQIAILTRTNQQLQAFSDALKANKVPHYLKQGLPGQDDEEAEARMLNAPAGVTLASLHSSKGLEWECVFLGGLSDGQMPISRARTPEAIEEERRLLYVGVTRAKERLIMSWAKTRSGTGKQRVRSQFLDRIWPSEGKT